MGAEKYLYGRKGPWPQPCPDHPNGESAGVLHVTMDEWVDWWLKIGSRYLTQWPLFTPVYLASSFLNPGCKPVTDEEFHDFLTKSMMSKFITPKLDAEDREIFKNEMTPGRKYYIVDLDAIKVIKTFPGMHLSPTKTLLERTSETDFKIKCIWMGKTETMLYKEDGDAWELAKYFVLQGGAISATLVVHPLLHFPLDCINAISKSALPKDHVLFQLLYPHLRFTLPLENAVLNFKMSLLHNDKWWKTYAPYPAEYKEMRQLLREGYKGVKNNDSYPAFRYPRRPPKIYSGYGVFLDSYYKTIYDFVHRIVKTIPRNDESVTEWANYISDWLPGFPDGEEIWRGQALTEVVAYFIWDVSVGHTMDHHNFGQMDVQQVPLRLRQEPPKKGTKMQPLKTLQSPVDLMKYKLAMRLFFKPTVVTKLIDVQYEFTNPELFEMAKRFKFDLRQTDMKLKEAGLHYMDLEDIANSIQF